MAQTLQQPLCLGAALGSGQLQPVARLLQLALAWLTIEATQLQLSTLIAGTRRLAQQLLTDAPITGIAAITAQQLAKAALGHHHPPPRRLLEQTSGQTLERRTLAQNGLIQQPAGQADGKATRHRAVGNGGQLAVLHANDS